MKRWLHPLHRGEELFSFLLGYSKSRLKKEQKKKYNVVVAFQKFFLDKKEQRRTRKLCNQIKSKNEDEWCKCLTKPPLLLTENRLFCSYKLFFPRVRCEGALRLPKFLFMAILVVEFSRRGYQIGKVFAQKSTCPKEIVKKCQNFTFKDNFLRQKSLESFSIFFIE